MDWYTILIISHIIGVALGVGGATVSDFLFLKTIKSGVIGKTEFYFLKTVSDVIWLGISILVVSGFGLLLLIRLTFPEDGLIYEPRMLAHFSAFIVLFFNGLVMHAKVMPLMEANLEKPIRSGDFCKNSRTAFTTGAISIVSWYFILIVGMWRDMQISYIEIISVYVLALAVAITVSNILGKKILNSLADKKA